MNLKVAGHTALFPGAGTSSDYRLRMFLFEVRITRVGRMFFWKIKRSRKFEVAGPVNKTVFPKMRRVDSVTPQILYFIKTGLNNHVQS